MTGADREAVRDVREAISELAELTGRVMAKTSATAELLADTRADVAILRKHLEGNGRPGLLERVAVLEAERPASLPPTARQVQARWQLVAGLIATVVTAIVTALAGYSGLE